MHDLADESALEGLRLGHTSAPTAINATAMICSLGQLKENHLTHARTHTHTYTHLLYAELLPRSGKDHDASMH